MFLDFSGAYTGLSAWFKSMRIKNFNLNGKIFFLKQYLCSVGWTERM